MGFCAWPQAVCMFRIPSCLAMQGSGGAAIAFSHHCGAATHIEPSSTPSLAGTPLTYYNIGKNNLHELLWGSCTICQTPRHRRAGSCRSPSLQHVKWVQGDSPAQNDRKVSVMYRRCQKFLKVACQSHMPNFQHGLLALDGDSSTFATFVLVRTC